MAEVEIKAMARNVSGRDVYVCEFEGAMYWYSVEAGPDESEYVADELFGPCKTIDDVKKDVWKRLDIPNIEFKFRN